MAGNGTNHNGFSSTLTQFTGNDNALTLHRSGKELVFFHFIEFLSFSLSLSSSLSSASSKLLFNFNFDLTSNPSHFDCNKCIWEMNEFVFLLHSVIFCTKTLTSALGAPHIALCSPTLEPTSPTISNNFTLEFNCIIFGARLR